MHWPQWAFAGYSRLTTSAPSVSSWYRTGGKADFLILAPKSTPFERVSD
jgi:hypothetical protein